MITYGSVQRPVAVSGVGLVSVFGTTHDAFRDALLTGRSGIVPIAGFETDASRSTLAAEIQDFQPTDWVPAMKLRRLDRTGVYAMAATRLALEDAQASLGADGRDDVGVVLGTWTAGGQSTQIFLEALFRAGPTGAPALLFDSTIGNSAAALAAFEIKARGPNVTISEKESSGLHAIATAVDLLREGRAAACLAAGVDAVFETFFKGHDGFAVMTPDREFSNRLAPFDAGRNGFAMGEGGFAMWLEAGGTVRHGEVLGVSMSGAAVPVNAWPDRPEPLVRSMHLALDDAGLTAGDVHVVYASANATAALDSVEAAALAEVFAGHRPIVTAIKGALGESGAAGVASCASALLCGAAGQVPPIAALAAPAIEAASLRLATTAMAAPGPIVLVNSFASGGALSSVVLRVRA